MLLELEEEALLCGGRKLRKIVTSVLSKTEFVSDKLGDIAKKIAKQSVDGAGLFFLLLIPKCEKQEII